MSSLKRISPYLFAFLLFGGILFILIFVYEKKVISNNSIIFKSLLIPIESRPETGAKQYIHFISPNTTYRAYKQYNDQYIYDVTYDFNEFSLREVPQNNFREDNQHLIFAGCSFIFGEGLQLEETLPYLVEQKAEGYHTYNWSLMGGGIHRLLHYYDFLSLEHIVKESQGKLYYFFIADHLNRFHGTPDYLSWAPRNDPKYLIQDGELVYQGNVEDTFSYQQIQFFKKIGLENFFVKFISIFKRNFWSDKELEDFAIATKALKERYLQSFPESEFVFIFHPTFPLPQKHIDKMKVFLKRHQVEFYDPLPDFEAYSNLQDTETNIFRIPHDGHPSYVFNQYFANYFLENILKRAREIRD